MDKRMINFKKLCEFINQFVNDTKETYDLDIPFDEINVEISPNMDMLISYYSADRGRWFVRDFR